MDIVHGWKPATELERAFARAMHRMVRNELAVQDCRVSAVQIPGPRPRAAYEKPEVVEQGSRYCAMCTTTKELSEFYRSVRDKRQYRCIECCKAYSAQYNAKRAKGPVGRT